MSSSTVKTFDVNNLLDKLRDIENEMFTTNMTKNDLKTLMESVNSLRSLVSCLEINSTENTAEEEAAASGGFTKDDIMRYSRQLILPNFGKESQLKLKNSSFLIVGCGGLGCPAAQYLAAAGCGHIGLVDYDEVELSNLHRQTLHTEARIGTPKAKSVRQSLLENNKHCAIDVLYLALDNTNALDIIKGYDVVLDCTDNVATRYLLNDACVMLNKPLVSGSALQFDGQLTVYHYGETGPCYRCLFPVPPPPEMVTNCSDGGILGAITGVIGSLQALEAIKVITGVGEILAGRLLIFDGTTTTFRNVKIRTKRLDCAICSDTPVVTRLINYEEFCGMRACDKNVSLSILPREQRISVQEYKQLQSNTHLLIDVRPPAEFEICHLPNAVNMPLKKILDGTYEAEFEKQLNDEEYQIIVLCRRGNDSQIAVEHMKTKYPQSTIHDIEGGLYAWHFEIDKKFPIY